MFGFSHANRNLKAVSMKYGLLALALGFGFSPNQILASPHGRDMSDVVIVPLTYCLEVPTEIKLVMLKKRMTNVGTEVCDHNRSACWVVNLTYKKNSKILVVKSKYCHGGDCFRDEVANDYLTLPLEGPPNERDKDKARAHIQDALDGFLAENEVKLCK